jgi:hypothetical protein
LPSEPSEPSSKSSISTKVLGPSQHNPALSTHDSKYSTKNFQLPFSPGFQNKCHILDENTNPNYKRREFWLDKRLIASSDCVGFKTA